MHKKSTFLVAGAVLAGLMTFPVFADDSDRAESWQFSFPITYSNSTAWDGAGDSSIDLSDDVGFGVGFGFNFSERFYVGGEITWIQVNYEVEVQSADEPPLSDFILGGELDASTFQVRGQYNFLEKTITPFIGGGIGWTYVDSNIASGPEEGVCWWDPWWGYVCDTWQSTYDDTGFSYGLNGGLRAELTDAFYMEARYGVLWIDTDSGDDVDVDGFRLELGWMFAQ